MAVVAAAAGLAPPDNRATLVAQRATVIAGLALQMRGGSTSI